ncbi:MAG: hypothetical protein PWP23_3283 [Candidatus Sumerlaeota bacterium]|nr:hypothetical protein [Candidatus Sumerlaeota bacterium]
MNDEQQMGDGVNALLEREERRLRGRLFRWPMVMLWAVAVLLLLGFAVLGPSVIAPGGSLTAGRLGAVKATDSLAREEVSFDPLTSSQLTAPHFERTYIANGDQAAYSFVRGSGSEAGFLAVTTSLPDLPGNEVWSIIAIVPNNNPRLRMPIHALSILRRGEETVRLVDDGLPKEKRDAVMALLGHQLDEARRRAHYRGATRLRPVHEVSISATVRVADAGMWAFAGTSTYRVFVNRPKLLTARFVGAHNDSNSLHGLLDRVANKLTALPFVLDHETDESSLGILTSSDITFASAATKRFLAGEAIATTLLHWSLPLLWLFFTIVLPLASAEWLPARLAYYGTETLQMTFTDRDVVGAFGHNLRMMWYFTGILLVGPVAGALLVTWAVHYPASTFLWDPSRSGTIGNTFSDWLNALPLLMMLALIPVVGWGMLPLAMGARASRVARIVRQVLASAVMTLLLFLILVLSMASSGLGSDLDSGLPVLLAGVFLLTLRAWWVGKRLPDRIAEIWERTKTRSEGPCG